MCGIVGVIQLGSRSMSPGGAQAFRSMMMQNAVRGTDGSGMFYMDARDASKVWWTKSEEAVSAAYPKKELANKALTNRFIVGHCRAATLGAVSEETAHPFCVDRVVGVHNGTVNGYKSFFGSTVDDAVNDSHGIMMALAGAEADGAVDVLKKITYGAYALVWYDARIQSLRMVRNSERPLYLYHHTGPSIDGDQIMVASEPGFIAQAIASATDSPYAYRGVSPFQLKTHTLLTLPINGQPASVVEYEPDRYVAPITNQSSYYGNRSSGHFFDEEDPYDYYNYYGPPMTYHERRAAAVARHTSPATTKMPAGYINLRAVNDLYASWNDEVPPQCGRNILRWLNYIGGPYETSNALLPNLLNNWLLNVGDEDTIEVQVTDAHASGLVTGVAESETGPIPVALWSSDLAKTVFAAETSVLPLVNARVIGVRAYCSGELGVQCTMPKVIGMVDVQKWAEEDETGVVASFLTLHPESWARQTAQAGEVDWSEGWDTLTDIPWSDGEVEKADISVGDLFPEEPQDGK